MKITRLLLLLAFVAVVLGFYRGWFSCSSNALDAGGNQVNVNLTVDPDKMKEDAEKVKEKTTELTDKAAAEARELGDQAKDSMNSDDD